MEQAGAIGWSPPRQADKPPISHETATGAVEGQATRLAILRLVLHHGPTSAVFLAKALGLTQAGIRRHLGALEGDGLIAEQLTKTTGRGRGRPARQFVATPAAQQHLAAKNQNLAIDLLGYLNNVAGPGAIKGFARHRAGSLTQRYAATVLQAGGDPKDRAQALVMALDNDGYAASLRPGPGGSTVQLCQGHCPIQPAAAAFPEMCEAETNAIAGLLGVHVQRLATLAGGHHVCTTAVPLGEAAVARLESKQAAK